MYNKVSFTVSDSAVYVTVVFYPTNINDDLVIAHVDRDTGFSWLGTCADLSLQFKRYASAKISNWTYTL